MARRIFAALFATAFVAACAMDMAQAQTAAHKPEEIAAHPAQIDKAGVLILIRQTLTALDLANKSGNYAIIREISAPGFAAANDSARLSALFRSQRDRNLDYSGVLAYEPQLTQGPETTKDGMLRIAGFFPSASSQIKFDMIFAPVNGQWKLFGLGADIGPAGPVAPMQVPQQSAPQPNVAQHGAPARTAQPSAQPKR